MLNPLNILVLFYVYVCPYVESISVGDYLPAEVAFEIYNEDRKSTQQPLTNNVSGEFLSRHPQRSAQGRVVWLDCIETSVNRFDDGIQKIAFAPFHCIQESRNINWTSFEAIISERPTDNLLYHKSPLKDNNLIVILKSIEQQLLKSIKKDGNYVKAKIQPPQLADNDSRKYSLHIASIIFVSVSFMILVLASLTWLGFYYMQRYRIARYEYNGRRRHRITIKKTVELLHSRILKKDDQLLTMKKSCAICIELFALSEHIRELPCKHCFHKTCVDPWLLSKHTCPLCKHNIVASVPKNTSTAPRGVENHVSVSDEQIPDENHHQSQRTSSRHHSLTILPTSSNMAPSTSDMVPFTSNSVPFTSNSVPSTSDMVPSTSDSVPSTSSMAPSELRDNTNDQHQTTQINTQQSSSEEQSAHNNIKV